MTKKNKGQSLMENILQWNWEKALQVTQIFLKILCANLQERCLQRHWKEKLMISFRNTSISWILTGTEVWSETDICWSARFRQPAGTSESGSRALMTVSFLIQSVLQAQFFRSSCGKLLRLKT